MHIINKIVKLQSRELRVHALIIASFILYCVFIADPLFKAADNMVLALQKVEITETNDINYRLSDIIINKEMLQVSGWAYIENSDTSGNRIRIVLKSKETRYVFNTTPEDRPDVTQHWGKLGTNLDNSGFALTFPSYQLKPGIYKMGIYITKNEVSSLEYTDKAIRISRNQCIEVVRTSERKTMTLPSNTNDITYLIESVESDVDAGNIEISGFAYIKEEDAIGSFINIVLKSNTDSYVFDTIPIKRYDITDRFGIDNINLNNAGFIARIPVEQINDGEYKIAIYISNNGLDRLQLTPDAIIKHDNEISRLLELEWRDGFSIFEGTAADNLRWCSSSGTLIINNHSNNEKTYLIQGTFITGYLEPSNLIIESSLINENLVTNIVGYDYKKEITIPRGEHIIKFSCDADRYIVPGESRNIVFGIKNFLMVEKEES